MAIKSKVLSKIDMGLVGAVANVGGTVFEYSQNRKQGDSVPVSVGKAAINFAVGEVLGLYAIPMYLIPAAIQGSAIIGQNTGKSLSKAYEQKGKFGSGYFDMSQAGYTMRQRSLNAIRQNGMNINTVLGNEARNYYRS